MKSRPNEKLTITLNKNFNHLMEINSGLNFPQLNLGPKYK